MIKEQKAKIQLKTGDEGATLVVELLEQDWVLVTDFKPKQLGYFISSGYIHHEDTLVGRVSGEGVVKHVALECSIGIGVSDLYLTFKDYNSRTMFTRINMTKEQYGLLIMGKKLVGVNASRVI